jgi:hypothetical protein
MLTPSQIIDSIAEKLVKGEIAPLEAAETLAKAAKHVKFLEEMVGRHCTKEYKPG